MNFEDQSDKGIGKFTSGTSKRRFIVGLIVLAVVLTGVFIQEHSKRSGKDPVDLVNPLMGTDSEYKLSNGNTYPAIALPWGMNFWTPQTRNMGNGWSYTYNDNKIMGIKQTHQPSPWINDYAAFSLMAMTGKIRIGENESSYILLDGFNMGSMVKIIPSERKVIGYCRNNHGGVPANFHNYFVAVFDHDFASTHTWHGDTLNLNGLEEEGDHAGAVLGFKTKKVEKINVRIASSFISQEQALLNLTHETGTKDFETIKKEGKESWNKQLGRINVDGGSPDQQRTFYSCLYRMILFPRQFFEINEKNEIVHYSPYNGEVLPGYMYTDNGFWDTFRAVFPFFTLMYPDVDSKIMEGLVNAYKESGWLPEWASPGHRDCMIGSNSASLIADSYNKGIRGYDIETLYQAIIKNTMGPGPVSSVGRLGADYYNNLGYVPYNVGINENAARTLEYAYADFCISQIAKELGKPKEEIDLYAKRATNYKNVFDDGRKLMRGRKAS